MKTRDTPVWLTAIPLVLLVPLGVFLATFLEPPPQPRSVTGDEPRIRVALIESAEVVHLELEPGWQLVPSTGAPYTIESAGDYELRVAGDGLAVTGEVSVGFPGAEHLEVRATHGVRGLPEPPFGLEGREYRGWLLAKRLEGGGLRAINSVGIEDYLAGVIGHEMPLRWSNEALFSQAIAARTYALWERKPQRDHDVKADTRSQVYKGLMSEDERARMLVDRTRGVVVKYEGELVHTFFHSTCGGDTVPAEWIFQRGGREGDVQGVVPLSGATGCTCQPSKFYRYTTEVDLTAQGAWRKHLRPPVTDVAVDYWPRGGYAKRATFTQSDGKRIVLSAWDTRRIFRLKAYAFTCAVKDGGKRLVFETRGWGHGVGMCQFGAEGFSKQGKDHRWILAHFYPGSTLESLGY